MTQAEFEMNKQYLKQIADKKKPLMQSIHMTRQGEEDKKKKGFAAYEVWGME